MKRITFRRKLIVIFSLISLLAPSCSENMRKTASSVQISGKTENMIQKKSIA